MADSRSQMRRTAAQKGEPAPEFPAPREVTSERYAEILRFVFNEICSPHDPRGPIDCIVPAPLAGTAYDAIVFMTATIPESESLPDGRFRLRSVGYRAGPAGDH